MPRITMLILLSLHLTACPAPSASVDSGPAVDGGVSGDAGSDLGGVCRQLAADIAAACGGQPDRTCEWRALADQCATQDPAALVSAMECILAESRDSCRTFSDPSGASSCLTAALTPEVDPDERAIADRVASLCSDDAQRLLTASVIPLAALSSANATRLRTCVDSAGDCVGAEACFASDLAAVEACYSTVSSPCEERAAEISVACGGQADRTCEWAALAGLCAGENDAAMTAAMDCILAESATSCRTFGDPSSAAGCIGSALAPYATGQAYAVAASIESLCALDVDAALFGGTPPVAALGEVTLGDLEFCLGSAVDCFDAEACLGGLQGDIVACYL